MEERIKIGMDAKRIVRNGTGLGNYGRTLVNDLAALDAFDLNLYAPDEGHADLKAQVKEGAHVRFCYPRRSFTPLGKALWRTLGVVSRLKADDIRVFHGLSGELPLGIAKSGIKSVVTIHDLIFLRHPEYYNKWDVKIYTHKFRQTLKEADRIVAISECTKRDICEFGNIDASRVDVIYQSCAPHFGENQQPRVLWQVRNTYRLPDRYVLCVGSVEQRKNILLAVKALSQLPDDVSLVVVGRQTPYVDTLLQYANENRLGERLFILHGVPTEHLPALYRMAEAFVYPSRYEGFGIPVIEAISAGLPVVACTGSCLEEAGGPDNLYVDPDDVRGMAAAVRQMLIGAEGREQRIERSRLYIKKFENSSAALRMAELYRSLTVE